MSWKHLLFWRQWNCRGRPGEAEGLLEQLEAKQSEIAELGAEIRQFKRNNHIVPMTDFSMKHRLRQPRHP